MKSPLFTPGFLFEPLGWIMDWLKAVVQSDPTLLTDISSLTAQRMHLIGLALAHVDAAEQQGMASLSCAGERATFWTPRWVTGREG